MDIDLLSKMVGELILDNDEVSLPGVGTFVAEIMPSTFSDKGYTINPPYRRLSFRQRETSDGLLAGLYARSNAVDAQVAASIVETFLSELRETLKVRKTIVFPGLGRLRATRENNFFFVPDEDLNIYPEGFGLEPVSLKTHVETEDDMRAAVASLQQILDEPVPAAVETPVEEPAAETPAASEASAAAEALVVEETPAAAETPVAEEIPAAAEMPATEEIPAAEEAPAVPAGTPADNEGPAVAEAPAAERPGLWRRGRPWWIAGIAILSLAAVLLIAFLVLARVAPDFIDSILYTQEELDIIRQI